MCYARRQRSSCARIKLSKILYLFNRFPDVINLISELNSKLLITLFEFSNLCFLTRFSHTFQCLENFCCSIFNDRLFRSPFGLRLSYYTHFFFACQPFSPIFFNFFHNFLCRLCSPYPVMNPKLNIRSFAPAAADAHVSPLPVFS